MCETAKLHRRDLLRFAAAAAAGLLASAVGLRALATPRENGGRASAARMRQDELKRPDMPDLSETERRILHLYYYDTMTPREIGVRLGLPESQVRRMHSDVLDRLRATLGTAQG